MEMAENPETCEVRCASEIFGARERPYDFRWGTPDLVKSEFGMGVTALKAAWASGWVRARQGNWKNDGKRVQTVYCFEDIHGFVERVMHRVSKEYAEKWWTDDCVRNLSEKLPDGPYRRRAAKRRGEAANPWEKAKGAGEGKGEGKGEGGKNAAAPDHRGNDLAKQP